jgi:hypothetical protein
MFGGVEHLPDGRSGKRRRWTWTTRKRLPTTGFGGTVSDWIAHTLTAVLIGAAVAIPCASARCDGYRSSSAPCASNNEGPDRVDRAFSVDMAGTYSNRTDILENFAELCKQLEINGPRRSKASQPRASGGVKMQLGPAEAAQIIAKYAAGTSMAQLKVEHHMAKRTVAKVLRDAGVAIRPRGGQPRS